MAVAVSAYTQVRIENYIQSVEKDGLAEHGFPRLTANMGVLIAHGRIPEQKETFRRMMDLCCKEIPTAKSRNGWNVGNDFSVKEIVLCLLEVEAAGIFPKEQTDAWRAALSSFRPEDAYSCIPEPDDPVAHNWAIFAAASEQMRIFAGLGGDPAFVERQIAGQLRFFDANGMYRDPNQPMVYDFVTRLQFAVALKYGYNGPSRPALEDALLRSAEPTLLMQSVSGEIPFGGRSNQFLHNETFYCALCEFYADWFHRRGDDALAARFRAAALRSAKALAYWTSQPDFRHVKNRFPLDTHFGCEGYGYFDKYMVTTGSWALLAHLFHSEKISAPSAEPADSASIFVMSPSFHRICVNAGGYTAEFDTAADEHYDANGLGRLQRRGAPPVLCLSVPCPLHPSYTLDRENPTPLAILPGWKSGDAWHYAYGADYTLLEQSTDGDTARLVFSVARENAAPLRWECVLSSEGLSLELSGDDNLALTLPALVFDGETKTDVVSDAHSLAVRFRGWTCRTESSGDIVDTGLDYSNRNGHLRRYEARGGSPLRVRIRITCQQ